MTGGNLGILGIARAVRSGEASALEMVRAALERIDARDAELNAFTAVSRERALSEANAVDAARAAGDALGPLAGVPYAVKNLFDIAGMATLAGSKINAGRAPAAVDATVVRRLRDAGAVLVGALNMDEYAYGFTTENSHYGATRNPHDPARIAGGSSGGSAAAVAGELVPLSLGSDTNGSIRVPASLCGIFGFKPTYGRLSRAGTYPFVASLDHVGPFARSVADLALAYDVMQGPDAADPACAQRPAEPSLALLPQRADGLRIAVAGGYFVNNAGPEALDAVARAAQALGATRTVTLPEVARARAAAFVMTAVEGANLHLHDLRTRAQDFEPLSRDRLLAGALIPASWYTQAQRFRRWYRDEVMKLFADVDVLLAPATPCGATLVGQESMTIGGADMLVRANMGMLTQPISFIGLPVVAAPVRQPGRMPVGVQIIAAPWREDHCLRVAAALEAQGIAVCAPFIPTERRP
ncbi:MAG: atzE [Noviherbaspirillum sp.]|nr:atzE [Noviherbaspirillum sp.]